MTLLTLGSGPLVASLLPTFGHRTLSLLGALLATLGLLLAGLYIELASSPQILFLHLTVGLTTGLGFGLLYLPAMDIVEHYFSKRLGLAMGIACCGSGLGQFLLAPLLHLATQHLGLASTLYCLAATVASAAGFALLYRLPEQGQELARDSMARDNMAFQYEQEQVHKKEETPAVEESKAKVGSYLSVLSQPAMLLLLSSHFLAHLGIFSIFSFSTDRAVQFGGLSHSESSFLLSVMGVSNCIGRVVFGQVLDRFRAHTLSLTSLVVLTNSLTVLSTSLVTGSLGHGLHSAVFGLTFGAYVTSVVPVLKLLWPSRVTAGLGLSLAIFSLASLAGPLAVGHLYDSLGSYSPGFQLVGALGVLGAALLPATPWLLHRGEQRGGQV